MTIANFPLFFPVTCGSIFLRGGELLNGWKAFKIALGFGLGLLLAYVVFSFLLALLLVV